MSEAQRVKKREISVLNWMGTLILASIPVVNLIMFIVWTHQQARHQAQFRHRGPDPGGAGAGLCVAGIAFFAPHSLLLPVDSPVD